MFLPMYNFLQLLVLKAVLLLLAGVILKREPNLSLEKDFRIFTTYIMIMSVDIGMDTNNI